MKKETKQPAFPLDPSKGKEQTTEVELITVTKDGHKLRVHPSCVEAHLAIGWELVD